LTIVKCAWTLHEQNQNANNRKDVAIDELEREVVELRAVQQLQGFYAQGLVDSLEEERSLEVRRADIASFIATLHKLIVLLPSECYPKVTT
jgi:hypothetical protein